MDMRRIELPQAGCTVSALCLGLADLGAGYTEADGFALIDAFAEAGGNFLDTARIYSDWVPGERQRSERVLGDYLASRGNREHWVIATKGCHPEWGSMAAPRVSPAHLRADLHESLRILRLGCIDLYYLHRDDPAVPVEPIVEALEECVRQGLIRAYGASNWRADRIRAANAYARSTGGTGFAANQMLWSLGSRHMQPHPDRTLVAWDDGTAVLHRSQPILAAPYSSQANGFFSKYLGEVPARDAAVFAKSLYNTAGNRHLADGLGALSREAGLPVSVLVLAFLLEQDFPVVPIVGPKSLAQLRSSLRAMECSVGLEVRRRLLALGSGSG
jgi:aryl-alcohol dehydrogenase-like predicted oxidoreductase